MVIKQKSMTKKAFILMVSNIYYLILSQSQKMAGSEGSNM
jgi:hypothetical protein